MIQTLSVTEMARNLADILNRVLYRRERFRLVRGGRPVADVLPVPSGMGLARLPDLIQGLPQLDEEEAASFSADLDEARREMDTGEPRDPWAS
jgi:antitoxin (DNA-binding transcriptional repressor) of toxin-antitoxin stability system